MRRAAAILLIVLFCTGSVFGQSTTIGVRGGGNFATFASSGATRGDFYTREPFFNGGFYLERRFQTHFGMEVELMFTRRGAGAGEIEVRNSEGIEQGTFQVGHYKFDYLQIPLLLKGTLLSSGGFQTELYFGPSTSYLLNSTFQVSEQLESVDGFLSDENIEASSFNFEVVAGAGLAYDLLGGTSVILDIRYTRGITNVVPGREFTIKNDVISVNAGFSVSL